MIKPHPLQQWRKENRIRLEQLAGQVGVTASHLSMLERGLRSASLDVALKLVEATGNVIPISAFAKSKEEPADSEACGQ